MFPSKVFNLRAKSQKTKTKKTSANKAGLPGSNKTSSISAQNPPNHGPNYPWTKKNNPRHQCKSSPIPMKTADLATLEYIVIKSEL